MGKRNNTRRDERGRWDIGGGGVEFGEKVEDCLMREIKEEYDAEVLDYEFLGFRDVHRKQNDQPTHWVSLDFKALVDPDQVKNNEPHKFDDINWFTFDALPPPNQIHSQLPYFLEKYKDKL